jgi:hypothetical protein
LDGVLVPEPFFALTRRKYVPLGSTAVLKVVDAAASVAFPRLAAPDVVPTSRTYPVMLPPAAGAVQFIVRAVDDLDTTRLVGAPGTLYVSTTSLDAGPVPAAFCARTRK